MSGRQERTFTEAQQQWIRDNWGTARTIEGMATQLRCRTTVLKRTAKILGLAPRPRYRGNQTPEHMAKLRARPRRKNNKAYHKHCERVKDVDGERSSPPPEGIRYSCPGCGMRALTPVGHLGCVQAA